MKKKIKRLGFLACPHCSKSIESVPLKIRYIKYSEPNPVTGKITIRRIRQYYCPECDYKG